MRILSDADRLEIAVNLLDKTGLDEYRAKCERREKEMTLLELAKQYKHDVEVRIKCIEGKRDNLDPIELAPYYQEAVKDCDTQIAHWKATLAIIRKTIEESEELE